MIKKTTLLMVALGLPIHFAIAQDNPIQFSLEKPLKPGLENGTFNITLSNVAAHYLASGPVINVWPYGLIGSLNELNNCIKRNCTYNGKPLYYFGTDLSIVLTCHNNASISYRYDASDVRLSGPVVLKTPAGCA